MPEENQTVSIMLRLQRVTIEDAYVAVPVTGKMMGQNADGSWGVNFEAFATEAIRIGGDPRVEWKVESIQLEPHPIQMPKPDDRRLLDAFHDL